MDNKIEDNLEKFFLDVEKETKKEEEKRYYLWTEWCSNWFDLVMWLDKSREKLRYKSLFLYRSLEVARQLIWSWKSVRSGAYHTTIREFRFVFESLIQAYYIDKEHPDTEIECKLEIIKEIDKLIGGKLIDNTDLKKKEKLKKLYSELCNYAHSSYEELKAPIEEGKINTQVTFKYDKELFDKCYIFTNKVMDAVIFILMSLERGIAKKIQEDKYIIQFLKETNYELSLDLINKVDECH